MILEGYLHYHDLENAGAMYELYILIIGVVISYFEIPGIIQTYFGYTAVPHDQPREEVKMHVRVGNLGVVEPD